jgi:hypothetical protein
MFWWKSCLSSEKYDGFKKSLKLDIFHENVMCWLWFVFYIGFVSYFLIFYETLCRILVYSKGGRSNIYHSHSLWFVCDCFLQAVNTNRKHWIKMHLFWLVHMGLVCRQYKQTESVEERCIYSNWCICDCCLQAINTNRKH